MNKSEGLSKTHQMVLTALFFALAIILSIVESALPPLPIAVPGVKFGLSNIAVMYTLFFVNRGSAFTIAALKGVFVGMTRGAVAGLLSLCGGLVSITVMVLLMLLFREKISYLMLSIAGSIFHNVGQFVAISLIYTSMYLWAYLPVLLISGIIAGVATATLLKVIIPAFKKLGLR